MAGLDPLVCAMEAVNQGQDGPSRLLLLHEEAEVLLFITEHSSPVVSQWQPVTNCRRSSLLLQGH